MPDLSEKTHDLVAFLTELEALSRRYDIWIRGPRGQKGDLPELYVGHGDERGYADYVLERGDGKTSQHFDVESDVNAYLIGDVATREPVPPLLARLNGTPDIG